MAEEDPFLTVFVGLGLEMDSQLHSKRRTPGAQSHDSCRE